MCMEGGWLHVCVCESLCCFLSLSWTHLEFWNLGHRPGIFILGGQMRRGLGAEDGRAGELYGGRNGLSLSPLFRLSLPCIHSQSSCPSPHSLYQAEE